MLRGSIYIEYAQYLHVKRFYIYIEYAQYLHVKRFYIYIEYAQYLHVKAAVYMQKNTLCLGVQQEGVVTPYNTSFPTLQQQQQQQQQQPTTTTTWCSVGRDN